MRAAPFLPEVPILWGDDKHDDRPAIARLFAGEAVYCMRTEKMITAPRLEDLPHGAYRVGELGQN